MSLQLINRSPDLTKLKDDGYEVEVRSGYLIIRNVPYVNSKKEVKRGTLVSELSLAGDVTTTPGTHVAMFAGEYPCDRHGRELDKIRHGSAQQDVGDGIVVRHSFSSKPPGGPYADYHHKMETYAAMISSHAEAIDPNATARTCRVIETDDPESVFAYIDTASSRAGISNVSRKLELAKVAIVGLGGTGSYVLDLVAKTPVREIQLFDGDRLLQHNAFRSPGAPSIEQLRESPPKVQFFREVYSRMHKNIVANAFFVDAENAECLRGMSFVFLCIDSGRAKKPIIEMLEALGIPFVDVGMGVELVDERLVGVLRVTTSTGEMRDHVRSKQRIGLSGGDAGDLYARNIQIADLNALNAALAVVKWKKLFGFYADLEEEHFSTYTLDGNTLINEDHI